MKKSLYVLFAFVITPYSLAATQPYQNAKECKAYYAKLKSDNTAKLNKEKGELGPGMPMVVYSDKLARIQTKYKNDLRKCGALTKT